MMEIQSQLSERAIELLALPDTPCLVLDLGCGSGLSGDCLTEQGHVWVGCDISSAMLAVARDREVDGDVILSDLGQGLGFRPGSFDGVISISALQWLCNADHSSHSPPKRLFKFFTSLYACMSRGTRAVFQLYPESAAQLEMITNQAMRAGFTGGLVIDFPNSTKAKKIFLTLFAGGVNQTLPAALGTEDSQQQSTAAFSQKRERAKQIRAGKAAKGSKDWIVDKKERRRRQGKEVRDDSKYTGRKRKGAF